MGTTVDDDLLHLCNISPSLFSTHLKNIAETGIPVVPFISSCYDNSRRQIAITFDDGFADNLYIAAPMLLKYKMPFTVFVTTSFVKQGKKGYLNSKELKELALLPGVLIGTHGNTHVPLTMCDDQQLADELRESKSWLEDLLGKEVSCMSYPHGAVNERVRDAARDAGYLYAGTSRLDNNLCGRDELLLARTVIHAIDSVRVLRQKIDGYWDWYRWRHRDVQGR